MNRIASLTLASIGLLSVGTMAIAQSAPAPTPRSGEARQPMDRATLQTRLATQFDAMDKNRDGSLTVEERQTQRTEARAKMRDQMFARLDANKDGSISKAEFNAQRQGARPDRPERARDGKRERSAEFRGHGRGFGDGMMPRQLAEYKDKPIPRATFIAAGLARFDRIDTDRNGTISAAERDASRKAMRDSRSSKQRPAASTPSS